MPVVKYHNDLNKVIITKLEPKELDIFFTIVYKMKETMEAVFSTHEIKKYLQGDNRESRFFNSLNKVFKTQLRVYQGQKITDYHLFITKELDEEKKEVKIEVHPKCHHILNSLIENYTKFELEEFIALKSDYSKNLFRLLMQYKDTGWREFEIEEFRAILEIPINYRQSNINQKVLNPVIEELKNSFKNVKVEKLKKGKNKRDISHIKFSWVIENTEKIEITEKQKEYSGAVRELFKLLPEKEQIENRKNELEKLLKEHSVDYLKADIEYAKNKAKTDFWAYFLKSIKSGHFSSAELEKKKMAEEKKKLRAELEEKEQIEMVKSEKIDENNLTEIERKYLEKAKKIAKSDNEKRGE
jgi:plasmid replication initiation protein